MGKKINWGRGSHWTIAVFICLLWISEVCALPSLVLSSSTNTFYEGQSEMFVDAGVTITGNAFDVIDGARVLIVDNYSSVFDQLYCFDPLSFTVSYDNAKGILAIDGAGNIQDYQHVLRNVKYKNLENNITTTGLKNITMSLGKLLAFKGPDHSTYHYYDLATPAGGFDWTQAKNAAAAATHFGLQGYLITVTSAEENAFAYSKFNQNIWIGASDVGLEGTWKWVTGPESGNTFWSGTWTGVSVGGYYENWYTKEPNDYGTGEDYAHFWAGKNGQWNDFPHGNKLSYIVEYGGMVGDPVLNLVDTVKTTIQENRAPTDIRLSDFDPNIFNFYNLVYEDVNPPTWSTKIWVTDSDPNERHNITFESSGLYPDNNKFSLSGNSTIGYTLTATSVFDYEAQTSLHIRLRATEVTGENKHVKVDIVIPLNNVNDPPTITTGLSNLTVNEDNGLLTQTIVLADPDTFAGNLIVLASSSNLNLISAGNLVLSGSGNVRTVSMTPTSNAYGSTVITVTCQDDLFGPMVTTTMTLTVNPVNDAPTHTVITPIAILEDSSYTFSGVQTFNIADIDVGNNNMEVTLSASQGNISLNGTAGLTFSIGDGASDPMMIFQGSLNAVNAALSSILYVSKANFYGTDSLVWTTSDLGSYGSGGAMNATTAVAITVTSVNDAPILHNGTAINLNQVDEDTPAGSGNTWQSLLDNASSTIWQDPDLGDPSSFAIVGSDNQNIGQWQTSVNGGATWNNLPSVTSTSSLLMLASTRLRFISNVNAFGQANILVKAWDGSNALVAGSFANTSVYSTSGAYSANTLVIQQSIRSMNDAPSWTMPSSGNTTEDVPVLLGAMILQDVDLGLASANVTVTVWNGNLSLSSVAGLTFAVGDGVSDNQMNFGGNLTAIQQAFSLTNFTPQTDFNGTALVQVSGNDLGQLGFGGAMVSSASMIILTSEVNDPPTLNPSVALAFVDQNEDQASGGHRVETLLTSPISLLNAYDDIDRRVPTIIPLRDGVALSSWSSNNGFWQVSYNAGGTWANFPVDDGRSFLLQDASAVRVRFLSNSNTYGTETINVRAWDGTEGVSGNLQTIVAPGVSTSAYSSQQSVLSVKVLPINDAPQIFSPSSALVTLEDTGLALSSAANTLSLYDVESIASDIKCRLNLVSSHGNLNFASVAGIVQSGSSSNIILSGNLTDLNRALDGLQYSPHRDFYGFTSLLVDLNDMDTTQNLPLAVSSNLVINVLAVNDLPIISSTQNSINYTENLALSIFGTSALSVDDVDDIYLQSANVYISQNFIVQDVLSVDVSGTSILANYNTASGLLSLTGADSVARYRTVLNSLKFNHLSENPDLEGQKPTRKLVISVSDALGASTQELQLNIIALDDAPQISSWDNSPSYFEDDVALILDSTISLVDPDTTLLKQALLTLTPFVVGDTLAATATSNIAVSWSSSTGILTMSGPARASEFMSVLQGLNYLSTSSDPDGLGTTPTRTCTLAVSDNTNTTSAQLTLAVKSFNDTPVLAVPLSLLALEDQALSLSGNAVTVSDADDQGADLQLSLSVAHGNLIFGSLAGLSVMSGSLTGDNLMVVKGSKNSLNSALLNLNYSPYSNYNGVDALVLNIDDMGNSGFGGTRDSGASIPINITPVNDAPVLPLSFTNALTSIEENDTNSSGNSVTSLLTVSGNLASSDADVGAGHGIAIVNNPSASKGQWQYSLNAGGFWQNFPSVSFTSALLLDGDAKLRFVPLSNFNGSANLIFHSWDRSSGHSSGATSVSLLSTGGQSAYSIATGEFTIDVSAVNDAPILTVPSMQFLLEDKSKLVQGLVLQDVDIEGNDQVQVTLSVARGTLSMNGSAPASSLTLTDTLANLNAFFNSGVLYQGLLNDHGTVSLFITASDLGNRGSGGAKAANGLVILNIDEVNDAPLLTTNLWSDQIQMLEDETNHAGWEPSAWCNVTAGSISDVDLNAGDNVWTNCGLAFTHLGTEVSGTWEQSVNGGGQWTTVSNYGSGNALLVSLQGDHRLRFVPAPNANGNLTLKFRAWDRTEGVPGDIKAISGTGAAFSYSVAEKSMQLEITPVNDAPSILAATLPQLANEDESVIFRLSQPNGLRLEDVDLSSNPAAICQLELSLSQANIQLSSMTGLQLLSGNISTNSLRVSGNLSALTNALNGMSLVPYHNFTGSDVLVVSLDDLGQVGSSSLFHQINLDIIFLPVNDPPEWLKLDGDVSTFTEGDLYTNLDVGNNLSIVDVDSLDFSGGRLDIIGVEQGTRNDRLIILDDSDLSTTGGNLTYQGNLFGKWSDVSQSQAGLSLTFSGNLSILTAVECVAKNIRYTNASKNPSAATRRFRWTLDDGDGGQARADVSLKVFAVNDDPTFVFNSANTLTYVEDQGLWSIFSGNIQLSDPDSIDFNNGQWTLDWVSGQSLDDQWSVMSSGNFSVIGADISYLGQPFAKILKQNSGDSIAQIQWLSALCKPETIIEFMKNVIYQNDSQKPDTKLRNLKMTISDGDGGLSKAVSFAFKCEAVNDAPTLTMGVDLAMPAVLEDSVNGEGWTIETLLNLESGLITEVDADPIYGFAVQLLDTNGTNGDWQYRLEESSWKSLTASSSSNLLLLRDRDRLRFTPKADYFGSIAPTLMVRAWDRSVGLPGEWSSVTSTGGTTPFSTNQRYFSLVVTGVPDAPVVTNGLVNGAKYASREMLWSEFQGLFSDVDNDTLQSVIIDTLPSNGNLMLGTIPVVVGQVLSSADIAKLLYIPYTTFTGLDSFIWRANDSQGTSLSSSTFSINVLPIFASISASQSLVNENVGKITLSVSLSVPSTGIVKLQLQAVQESLTNYKDIVLDFGSVEFPKGSTLWQREILVVDDLEVESTETMGFLIGQAQLCDIAISNVQLSVTDNDVAISGELSSVPKVIVEWLDPAWVRESGTTARMGIRLSQDPGAPLTLQMRSSDLSEGVLSTDVLNFNSSNWNVPQILTVTGVADQLLDGNQEAAVIFTPSEASWQVEPSVFINIDINGQGLVMIHPLPLITSEAGAQTMLLLTLQTQPSSNVLLTPIWSTADHQLSSPSILFTSENWDSPHVLIVQGLDNLTVEGDRFLDFSWLPSISTESASSGLRPEALEILHKDNDGLSPAGTQNLPPYRLILKNTPAVTNVLNKVSIFYDAEDPELNMGLRGGIVSYSVFLDTGSGFKRFEASSSTTFVTTFQEAGIYKLEVRAMDLLGAISLKQLPLVVQGIDTPPWSSASSVTQSTAPLIQTWHWKDFVMDDQELKCRLIEWDLNGDGLVDVHGYPDDPKLDSVVQRFDHVGQFEPRLRVTNANGEVFSLHQHVNIVNGGASEAELSLALTSSSAQAPALVSLKANLSSTSTTIANIEWFFGEEHETSWDISGSGTDVQHEYQLPGTYTIKAKAILSNGKRCEAQTKVHLLVPTQAIAVWRDMSSRLPFGSHVGYGFPLQTGVWPPQGQLLNASHRVQGTSNVQTVEALGSLLLSENSLTVQINSSSEVLFFGQTITSVLSQKKAYRSDFVTMQGLYATTSSMALPWSGNASICLNVHDGSSLFAPPLGLNNAQSASMQLLGDSGLTTQGLPSHLRSIYRDVRFILNDGVEVDRPHVPVVLELAYDDKDQDGLVDGYGVSENDLVAMRFDHQLNRWVNVEYSMTHPLHNVVRVKTAHLSEFGLFISGQRDVLPENNSGGGCLLK
jgi:hypothetical protein